MRPGGVVGALDGVGEPGHGRRFRSGPPGETFDAGSRTNAGRGALAPRRGPTHLITNTGGARPESLHPRRGPIVVRERRCSRERAGPCSKTL